MEYVPFGPLKCYIPKKIGLPVEVVKVYAAQLVVFLEYLHCELEVCHRDLKPGNIMIGANLYLKVVSNKFNLRHKFKPAHTTHNTHTHLTLSFHVSD